MNELAEIAYFTEELDAMARFYQRLLGSPPVAQSESMAIFMAGKTKIFLHKTYVPSAGELPPESHVAFRVPDVGGTCRELESQGLKLEVAPHDYYWGRSAYLRDPDGHLIELTEAGPV